MKFIIGSTSGIGHATAVLFNKLGASLVITGRSPERLADLSNELLNNHEVYFDANFKALICRFFIHKLIIIDQIL